MKMTALAQNHNDKILFVRYFNVLAEGTRYDESILKKYALKLNRNNVDELIEKAGIGIEDAESQVEEDTYTLIGKALTTLMYEYYQDVSGDENSVDEIYTMLDSNKKIIESEWYKKNRKRIKNSAELLVGGACRNGQSILASEWSDSFTGKEYYLIDSRRVSPNSLLVGREMFRDDVDSVIPIDENFEVVIVNRIME